MKYLLWFLVLACSCDGGRAEKATFDLVRYTPPAPWKQAAWDKEVTNTIVKYTSTDPSNGSYCQIAIVRSTASKNDLNADFDSEWNELIVKSYKDTQPATITDATEQDGWQVKAGVTTFAFDNGTSIAMLTTISGYGRVTSVIAVTSSADYMPAIQAFLGSVEMIKPNADPAATATPAAPSPAKEAAKPAALQGYMEYNPFTKSWTWKVRYPPQ
jgi:hypothetical protein